jgi:hypothetical protein
MICFVWRSSAESERLMHRSLETRMRDGVIACVLVLIAAQILTAAEPAVMESTKVREDVAPGTDPTIPFWRGTRLVVQSESTLKHLIQKRQSKLSSRGVLHLEPVPRPVWDAEAVRHIMGGLVVAGHRCRGRPSEVVVQHLSQRTVVG